uniref:Uncharacterized protein n=1 Tax=Ciona intestinalis TaxID=7719 RepID=H2XYV0_CIOIN
MFQRPCHLYSLIDRYLTYFKPKKIPNPLHRRKSKTQWSHQHSEKFGNWCSKVYSSSSNAKLSKVVNQKSLRIRALKNQPKK